MYTTNNTKDTGSLHVGLSAPTQKWEKGQKIRLTGEQADRIISYVMGSGEKTHLCTKGFGPFPLGEVQYGIVTE